MCRTVDLHAIYDAHFDYVWHTLRRLGIRHEDCEDLAHDVFLVVHRRAKDFDNERPMKPWLFGISYRVVADFRRLAKHSREVFSDAEHLDERPDAEATLEQKRKLALCDRALAKIDLERRAVLVLHDIDGEPVPQVAEALGIPLNTAYSRLRVAREEFAAAARRLERESAR